jgi:hypothetical protein
VLACGSNVPETGCEDDVGQVTLNLVNNTAMQASDVFLLDYNEEDPIGRMVSIKYDGDVLVGRDGSIKWCRRKKKQLSCLHNVVCFPVLLTSNVS